jgi:hypothetical protein
VFVSYMTQDMSARAGQDFLGKSDVLVWDGNDTSIRTISLIILGSDSPESEEDFAVILNNPSTGSVVGSPNTAVVTYLDTSHLGLAWKSQFKCSWMRPVSHRDPLPVGIWCSECSNVRPSFLLLC